VNHLKLWTLAVSLGNVETLIQHAASMTFASLTPEQRKQSGVSEGLLRLSVGIERAEDIITDLERGLSHV
jgi:cystathionine beta-lyase/cystathionine gamma-synthase